MVQIEEVEAETPKSKLAESKKGDKQKKKSKGDVKLNDGRDEFDSLMNKMQKTKEEWDEDDDGVEDEQDAILSQAIEMAIEQGRGWAPGEKEAYLEKILDDDFIPPLFCSTQEELEKTGLKDAFTSLIYDGESPTSLMLSFKKKGNEAFANGRRNEAKNLQYYRDAVNHYYEAIAWANKIESMMPGDLAQADTDDPTFTEEELDVEKSNICNNIALAHMQIRNWGHVRDESKRALAFNPKNVKACYRLAKAHQNLQNWEEAGQAIETGLAIEVDNKDLKKLQTLLDSRIQKARKLRQQRERKRAERVMHVKKVWMHCKEAKIQLGRVPLVTSVTDDEEDDDEHEESRWHFHLPHTGELPTKLHDGDWAWPCMFLYPSHHQSDYVKHFGESEMLAVRMAEMFPELDDCNNGETAMPWDFNNEFSCSQLAVYFEIQVPDVDEKIVHPDHVEMLRDQAATMRFYESSRALKGDEGPEIAEVIRAVERKHLYKQRKAWKKKHGSLWSKPDPCSVVRVHPAMTLRDVLLDKRLVVPNFLVTFVLFPEKHPAHAAYLKEHKCVGIIQPEGES